MGSGLAFPAAGAAEVSRAAALGRNGTWLARDRRVVLALIVIVIGLFAWDVVTKRPVFGDEASFASRAFALGVTGAAMVAQVAMMARFFSLRAAVYAALVLASTPAWFVRSFADGDVLAAALPLLAFASVTLLVASRRRMAGALVIILPVVAAGVALRGVKLAPATGIGFAALVPHLAYALAPWAPLVPAALAYRRAGEPRVRIAIAVGAFALLTLSSMTHVTAASAESACGLLACAVGLFLADLDEAASASSRPIAGVMLPLTVLAIGALLAHDVVVSPDRVLDVLAPSLPTGHATSAARDLRGVVWLVAGSAQVALFAPWLLGARRPSILRRPGLIVVALGTMGGLFLRLHSYPSLAQRVSPGRAYEAWVDHRRDGDELGLLGVDGKRWPQKAKTPAQVFRDPDVAARWLVDGAREHAHPRRFLAIGPGDLARLNASYRSRVEPRANIPILAGKGSAFLLGASSLDPSEASESPLDDIVRGQAPADLVALPATLDGLDVLGWELRDANGAHVAPAAAFPARASTHLRVAMRVTSKAALSGYCTFLHVEHTPTRFNVEHKEHPYPMALWREGDVVIDDFTVDLPPHFTRGSYAAFWGVGVLPCQDDQRMRVVTGPHDGHHRVSLGRLEVK